MTDPEKGTAREREERVEKRLYTFKFELSPESLLLGAMHRCLQLTLHHQREGSGQLSAGNRREDAVLVNHFGAMHGSVQTGIYS